jgi:hypothetical protein
MARRLFHEIYGIGDSLFDSGGFFDLSSQVLTLAAEAGVDTTGLQPIPISPYEQFQRTCAPRNNRGPARRGAH